MQRAGYSVLATSTLDDIKANAAIGAKVALLGMVSDNKLPYAINMLPHSQSQINQDYFVLQSLNWKHDGYFVEFGATNGKDLSNSWLLEKKFGWKGILAEPGRVWRNALLAAGRLAELEFECVWSASGELLTFAETEWAELSTIGAFQESDAHSRKVSRVYQVRTVSLLDMLERYNAPKVIDYLSIDTEGSEFEILNAFDFNRYVFRCLTVEHNFSVKRDAIHSLLTGHGYQRVHESLSQFDDWYVKS